MPLWVYITYKIVFLKVMKMRHLSYKKSEISYKLMLNIIKKLKLSRN